MTSSRRMTALAIICMAASFVVALVTATRISGPSIRPDEWGYLLNGQVLIGHEEVRLPFSEMYPAGFGFVTGAWAWISGSLHSAYRLTLFTNVALIAVLAYDSVSTCKDRSKEITLFLMANNVEGILNNYRLKAYPQEKVFMFSYN